MCETDALILPSTLMYRADFRGTLWQYLSVELKMLNKME
jgi:hypothetical protein